LLCLRLIRQVLLLPRQLLMLKIEPLQLQLRLRFHLLEVITLGEDLLLEDLTRLSLLSDGLVQKVVPLSDLLNHFRLSIGQFVGQLEGLLVSKFKVALIAYEVLSLVSLGKPPLVLPALIAHSARASFAVMAALLREGTELLGKSLVAREALISILDLVFTGEFLREPLETFLLLPKFMIFDLLMAVLWSP
jgi:hypothetical protein